MQCIYALNLCRKLGTWGHKFQFFLELMTFNDHYSRAKVAKHSSVSFRNPKRLRILKLDMNTRLTPTKKTASSARNCTSTQGMKEKRLRVCQSTSKMPYQQRPKPRCICLKDKYHTTWTLYSSELMISNSMTHISPKAHNDLKQIIIYDAIFWQTFSCPFLW